MYFLISGDDTYRSHRRLTHLRERFLGTRDPSGLNVMDLESNRDGLPPLLEAILTIPFLADRKFVIARGYLQAPAADQQTTADFLAKLPETTNLIFFEGCAAADLEKSPLYPLLKGEKHTQDFPSVGPGETLKIFTEELENAGIRLTKGACVLAATLLPPDSWQITQEAEKLIAWCGGRGLMEADEAAVREVVVGSKEEPSFAFLDACLAGQVKQAVIAVEGLLAADQNEHQVLAAITRQIRTLVAVRDCLDRGLGDKREIAAALKMHPYPVEKAIRSCSRLDAALLRRIFDATLDTEANLKTGQADRSAVELLAIRLAAATGKR
jgi:DNA polymerase-3 subunit delta